MAKPSTDPAPEDISDVDILGMADALNISVEDRGLFSSPNEESKEEAPEIVEGQTEDAKEVASEEEKSTETEDELKEEKEEDSDEKEGKDKEKEDSEEEEKDEEEEEETSGVQKRINKLTARNKEYESQIEELKSEMEELKSKISSPRQPVAAEAAIPLGDVFDLNGLNQARENALEVKEWALSNPDGGSYKIVKDGKEEEVLVTKEQATKLLVNASRMLDRDIPTRRQYLEEAQGNWVEARRAYPSAFDEKHPDSKQAGSMVELFPQIKQFPDWPLLILDMLAGQKMRLASKNAKPADTTKKVVPFQNGKAPKVVGSPQSQSGPRTKVVKTVNDVAKVKNEISEDEAAELLNSFM